MQHSTGSKPAAHSGPDWRGWIVLGWVIFAGCGYSGMAYKERGQRVLDWFRPARSEITTASPHWVHDPQKDLAFPDVPFAQ